MSELQVIWVEEFNVWPRNYCILTNNNYSELTMIKNIFAAVAAVAMAVTPAAARVDAGTVDS